jgi:D-alanine transaminase
VRDGALVTHELGTSVLPGITRERIFTLAQAHGIVIHERRIATSELATADELFITAATAFVMPIVQVDGATVGAGTPGPVTTQLRAAYIDSVRGGAASAP